ncbi:hypothetical protein EFA69_14345 [Rufibacter immobilis]|uniref:Transglutaminase-like domain-containing protein n=1 Tax=Rufibacter immobilis TaxID=1348778 RepID=A0A3M9MR16_9BACT|nr:transglutaminase domain-containing protein [Rufibacter immobilis]RNI27323.1 hypothetical protein EFA69_14345 [Rufibacter immobilis]
MPRLLFLFFFLPLVLQAQAQSVPAKATPVVSALAIPSAQTKTTQALATYLNSHLETEEDKVHAIFFWLVSNIAYDVKTFTNAPLYYEREALIRQTMATRKALCQGYAEVFLDLCTKTDIQAHLITGFILPKGTAKPMTHAWCAAQVNGQWYLFDPTWGAGFVENGVFVKKLNPRHFKVSPAEMIKTHMPFDPLWQLLEQPVSYQQFLSSSPTTLKPKTVFAYKDTLKAYASAAEKARLVGAIRRMESQKVIPPVVLEQLNQSKKNLAVFRKNEAVDLFNTAVSAYNKGIDGLNGFIRLKNNQFKTAKREQDIRQQITGHKKYFSEARELLQRLHPLDNTSLLLSVQSLHQKVAEGLQEIEKQEKFLEVYFSTAPARRHTLFYRQAIAERQ